MSIQIPSIRKTSTREELDHYIRDDLKKFKTKYLSVSPRLLKTTPYAKLYLVNYQPTQKENSLHLLVKSYKNDRSFDKVKAIQYYFQERTWLAKNNDHTSIRVKDVFFFGTSDQIGRMTVYEDRASYLSLKENSSEKNLFLFTQFANHILQSLTD